MLIKTISNSGPLLQGVLKLNALVAIGSLLEKKTELNMDSSTLSFLLASSCSTIVPKLATLDPRIESLGWSYFLQGALICGLWAGKAKSAPELLKHPIKSRSWKEFIPVIAVFLIGCLGSLVGGFLGFHVVSSITVPSVGKDSLSILSACLTASYIGGTVNFFETAKSLGATGSTLKKLLFNVASIDIGVMVAYFWLLRGIRNSSMMNLLPQRKTSLYSNAPEKEIMTSTIFWMSLPFIVISAGITFIANFIQDKITIPGVSVIFATIVGLAVFELVQKLSGKKLIVEETETILIGRQTHFFDTFGTNSRKASDYLMSLFYTTIGLSFRVEAISKNICILMGVTLGIHLIFIFSGSMLYNTCVKYLTKKASLKMDKGDREENGEGNKVEGSFDSTLLDSSDDIPGGDSRYLINLDTAIIARCVLSCPPSYIST